jgi:hypothetical protein
MMSRHAWIAVPVALGLLLPAPGCGLFRRRTNVNTSVSSSVEVNQTGRDIATLQRHEYEVLEISVGQNKSTSVFLLTLPVGGQTSHQEQVDTAYSGAVARVKGCDAMLFPRVETKRVLVPLLLVNFAFKTITIKGRCIHIKGDGELAGGEGAGSDTGGGGGEPAEAGDGGGGDEAPAAGATAP